MSAMHCLSNDRSTCSQNAKIEREWTGSIFRNRKVSRCFQYLLPLISTVLLKPLMSNPLTLLQAILHSKRQSGAMSIPRRLRSPMRRAKPWAVVESRFFAYFVLGLILWCAGGHSAMRVQGAFAQTPPRDLENIVEQIDAAANRQDIEAVMDFYSASFISSDGLTRDNLEAALVKLWQRYPSLNYRTEIESWERVGNGYVAETVTEITGVRELPQRELSLLATVRSRQRYENQKVLQQDILDESSRITSGENPPTLKINLPEEVRIGQRYNFDAIVQEPLGEDLLLGYAVEEPIGVDGYLTPSEVELEPLSAGGIFKVGEAPFIPDNRWISAIVVRKDGLTMVTERLRVVEANP